MTLRELIERATNLPERSLILEHLDGDRIVAPAGRPAAVIREALAAAGIRADVIEREPPAATGTPETTPNPEPRKRKRKRKAPKDREPAPELTAEARADLIAAERPADVAAAIRAHSEALSAELPDRSALPDREDRQRLDAWEFAARKPRPTPGDLVLRVFGRVVAVDGVAVGGADVPTRPPEHVRTITEAEADQADRDLIDLARALGLLTAAVDVLPRSPSRARLATVGGGWTRQPAVDTALLPAIEVAAVAVDGLPVASPHLRPRRVYRPRARQLALTGPRTLDARTFDPLLYSADAITDPTVRADTLHLARIAVALVRPLVADADQFARILTGKTGKLRDRDRRRATEALAVLRGLLLITNHRTGDWIDLADVAAYPGDRYAIGRPRWADAEGPKAWRLTAGLFRPGLRGQRDTFSRRAVDGIEAALSYSAPPDRTTRTAALLLPANGKSGPGTEVRIAGADVLRMAGVEVGDGPLTDVNRKRLSRLFEHLTANGYGARGRREAEAGDSVELVERVAGNRGQTAEAAFVIRASARFVEATRKAEGREAGAFGFTAASALLPAAGND